MKLPYKSIGSVQRHVNIIEESAGSHLREMALAMFPKENIRIAYRVIHAMANSDSERTLIAVFEKA
jgi:precorrin isomerase